MTMSPLLRFIGRGALAGAIAGLLSALVSFLLGEPSVRRAIALEEAAAETEHAEVFSRAAQQGALFLVSVITGLAVGILFGVVYALRHRRNPYVDSWRRAMQLAVAGLVGIALIPFVRYPANPPAVGDPGTVDDRTTFYLAAILMGLAAVVAADQLSRGLAERDVRVSLRQLATAGVVAVGMAATWLLPDSTDSITVPAELIWNFRLASIATLVVLWLGLGAIFGLLGERAERGLGGTLGPPEIRERVHEPQ
jgi:predicted cobalt transporter CbtA